MPQESPAARPLQVRLGDRSYEIHIGPGLLALAGELIAEAAGGRGFVITHPALYHMYGEALQEGLQPLPFEPIFVPVGERQKSLRRATMLWDDLLARGADRKTVVAAFGGGVIGDLSGFVAATYMRGLPYVQMPTSLLAQVDAAVGGKVAINHPRAKNLIGCFYQPRLVIADVSVLTTLPARDYRAGLAEVIKTAIISDHEFFKWLEANVASISRRDIGCLSHIVRRCCEVKAEVVRLDERESGLREILNLGHTIGHALETLMGYRALRHGEAVAIGLVAASRIAQSLDLLTLEEEARIAGLLTLLHLPTRIPGIAAAAILSSISADKKAIEGKPRFTLPLGIGRAEPGYEVDQAVLERILVDLGAAQ